MKILVMLIIKYQLFIFLAVMFFSLLLFESEDSINIKEIIDKEDNDE